MTEEQQQEDWGRSWAYTASEAFHASASYFRALPDHAWSGPTGCAEWDERTLSGHILGEAVWFPNVLRGITDQTPPHPAALYEEMNAWPAERQSDRLDEAADELRSAIDAALPRCIQASVDVGWMQLPLWRSTYVILMEGVYHNWDARAGRDPQATIPTSWATQLADGIEFMAPLIAHRDALGSASGRYLLEIGDGVGAVTVDVERGGLTVERRRQGEPDVTLHLSADQAMRLIAGRFTPSAALERGEVKAEGELGRLEALHRVFGGIANG